ncbi:DNA cytosine methyltransferase, partial [Bacillus cereus]
PQNRERVFIIGYSRNKRTSKVFPIHRETKQNRIKVIGNTNASGWRRGGELCDPMGLSPTITCKDAPKILLSNQKAA